MNWIKWIRRTFGLRGSWRWACKQMERGYIVRRATDTGAAKYRLDLEGQRRIQWAYTRTPEAAKQEWNTAYVFLSYFESLAWEVWPAEVPEAKARGEDPTAVQTIRQATQ